MQRSLFAVLLIAVSSFAQFGSVTVIHRLRVKVVFSSGTCDPTTLVSLVGRIGALPDHRVDQNCIVQFLDVPVTTYQLTVSGPNVAETYTESLDLSLGMTEFQVKVKSRADSGPGPTLANPCVSVTDLGAPAKARRELQKGTELLGRKKLDKAKDHLLNAIAIYPRYAAAYNNLAVVYARLGDRVQEWGALQKAVGIDDHLSAAYLNLARLRIAEADFPAAETALTKASICDNGDVATLDLLAYAQLKNGHLDDALATSQRAHSRGGVHSTVHWVAERVFKIRHQIANATAEMETFLREEPDGARANAARKELKVLQSVAP
jgi:tetratricopeptide (TPR) repeat protein